MGKPDKRCMTSATSEFGGEHLRVDDHEIPGLGPVAIT